VNQEIYNGEHVTRPHNRFVPRRWFKLSYKLELYSAWNADQLCRLAGWGRPDSV